MNKIFKVIWSKAKGCYVVVSEIAKNQTKSGRRRARDLALAAIVGIGVTMSVGSGVVYAEDGDDPAPEPNYATEEYVNQIVGEVKDTADAAKEKAEANEAAIEVVEGKVATAQSTAEDAATKADENKTAIEKNATAIAGVKSTADAAAAQANENAGKIETNANAIAGKANQSDLDEVNAKAGANTDAIAILNGDENTDGSVAYAVKAEATRATAAEQENKSAIEAEATRAKAAEGVNKAAIEAEVERAKAAEQANTDAIAILNGDENTNGSVAYAVKAEATRATAAEQENKTAIEAEATRATAAEQENKTAIEAEATRAKAAEGVNKAAIEAEADRAKAAEKANTDAIAAVEGKTTDISYSNGLTSINGNAAINGSATIFGSTAITGDTTISGDTTIGGGASVAGDMVIGGVGGNAKSITLNSTTGTISGLTNTQWTTPDTMTDADKSIAATQGQLFEIAKKGYQLDTNKGTLNVPLASEFGFLGVGNIETKTDGSNINISIVPDPTFNKVTASVNNGASIAEMNNTGFYISPTGSQSTDRVVSLTSSGLSNGHNQLKDIAEGTDTNDAVTLKQLLAQKIEIVSGNGNLEVDAGTFNVQIGNDVISGTKYTLTFADKDTKPKGDGSTTTVTGDATVSVMLAPGKDGGAGSIIADGTGLKLNPVLALEGSTRSMSFDAEQGSITGLTNIKWYENHIYVQDRVATEGQLNDIVNTGWKLGGDNNMDGAPLALNKTASIVGGESSNIKTTLGRDENGNLSLAIDTKDKVAFEQITVQGKDTAGNPTSGSVVIDSESVSGLANTSFFTQKPGPTAGAQYIIGDTYYNYSNGIPSPGSTKAATEAQLVDLFEGLNKADRYVVNATVEGNTVKLTQNNAKDIVFEIPTTRVDGSTGQGGYKPNPDVDNDGNYDNWYISADGRKYENTTLATMNSTKVDERGNAVKSSTESIASAMNTMAGKTPEQVTKDLNFEGSNLVENGQLKYGQDFTIMDTAGNAITLTDLASASVLQTVHGAVINHDKRIVQLEGGFHVKAGNGVDHMGEIKAGDTFEFTGNANGLYKNNNIVIDYDNKYNKLDISITDAPKFELVEIGDQTKALIDSTGIRFAGEYYIGPEGLSANGFAISKVKNGDVSPTSNEAVNGSQLYPVQQAIKDGFSVNGNPISLWADGADGFYINDGNNIKVSASGNSITVDTSETPVFKAISIGTGTDVTKYITINAADEGTIRNLKNTEWRLGQMPTHVDQAATEGQLSAVDVGLTNKGMNFVGDDAESTVHKGLGSTLKIVGGATEATDNNIKVDYVEAEGNPYLKIGLAKNIDLSPDGSVKVNNAVLNKDGLTVKDNANDGTSTQTVVYNEKGMTLHRPTGTGKDNLVFTDDFFSAGDLVIQNVASGLSLGADIEKNIDNAATIGDVLTLATSHVGDKNITIQENDDPNQIGKKIATVTLNPVVTLGAEGSEKITLNGTEGTAKIGSIEFNGGAGHGATIAGLSNTTYGFSTNNQNSGQVATVGQLHDIVDKSTGGWGFTDGDGDRIKQNISGTLAIVGGIVNGNKNIITNTTDKGIEINLTNVIELANSNGTDMVTINGQEGTIVVGNGDENRVSINGESGVIAAGKKLNLEGASGTGNIGAINFTGTSGSASIDGLSNTGWDAGHNYSGSTKAATESQLYAYQQQDKDYTLVHNPADLSGNGAYEVDKNGIVALKVKDQNGIDDTPQIIEIKGVASTGDIAGVNRDIANIVENLENLSGEVEGHTKEPITFYGNNGVVSEDGKVLQNGIDKKIGEALAIKGTADGVTDTTAFSHNIYVVSQNGAITIKMLDDITVNSVTADEIITVGDKTRVEDGSITITNTSGGKDTTVAGDHITTDKIIANTAEIGGMTLDHAAKDNLAGASIERLKYSDHIVATMEDGLKFAADNGNPVSKTLNETVTIKGDDANITTSTMSDSGIQIALNKDVNLTDKGSLTVGATEVTNDGVKVGGNTIIKDNDIKVSDIQLDGANTQIKVGDNTKIGNGSAKLGNVSITGESSQILIGSDDNTKVKIDGAAGTLTTGGVIVNGANNTLAVGANTNIGNGSATIGDVVITGTAGNANITGLGNTTWDRSHDYSSSKQAATEAQLQAYANSDTDYRLVSSENGYDIVDGKVTLKVEDKNGIGQASTVVINDVAKASDLANLGKDLTTLTNSPITFYGNDGVAIEKKLGSALEIKGTASDVTGTTKFSNNIYVVSDNGSLTIKMLDDISLNSVTAKESITVGDTSIKNGTITITKGDKNTVIEGDNITADKVTVNQVSIGGSNIEHVTGPATLLGGDTPVERLKYGGHVVATMEDGLKFTADDRGTIVKKQLNETLTIKGDDTSIATKVDNGEIQVALKKDVNLTEEGSLTVGAAKITNDGVKIGEETTIGDKTASIGNVAIDGVNSQINIGSGASKIQLDGAAGTIAAGLINLNGALGTGKVGDIVLSGTLGSATISGLSNTTWDKNKADVYATSTNAATEAQLQAAISGAVGDASGNLVDKGLNFAGDSGADVHKALGEKLTIKGGETDADKLTNGNNIGVVAKTDDNGNGILSIQLSKNIDLTNEGSLTIGNTIIGDGSAAIGKNIFLADGSLSLVNGKFTIDVDGNINSNFAEGSISADSTGFVVNHGDSKVMVDDRGTTFRNGDDNGYTNISGSNLTAGNVVINGAAGTIATGNININGAKDQVSVGTGGNKVTIDGQTGTLGGLTNTSWNPNNITSGQAATEDQLKEAMKNVVGTIAGGNMTFAGDSGSNIEQVLGDTLNVKGGATGSLSEGNIGVVADAQTGTLNIKLADDIKLDSVTAADKVTVGEGANKVEINGATGTITTGNTTIGDGSAAIGNVNVNGTAGTINGLTNKTWDANNITSGQAATEDQLKAALGNMADSITSQGMSFAGDSGADSKMNLGQTVTIKGGETDANKLASGNNIGVVSNGSGTLTVQLAQNIDLGDKGSLTIGNTKVNNDEIKIGDTTIDKGGMSIKDGPSFTKDKIDAGGNKVTNIGNGEVSAESKDAVSGSQLFAVSEQVERNASNISKMGSRINKVGARAAALAALHPMDYDPDDKLSFAGGYGNYQGESAGAIGAFYRPDEKTMFSLSGTVSNQENMFNAGVSFSLDRSSKTITSKSDINKQISDLTAKVEMLTNGQRPTALGEAIASTGRVMSRELPDLPKEHWAYAYVEELTKLGYIKGNADGSYNRERILTRYEVANTLYRALMNGAPVDDKMGRGMDEFSRELDNVAKAAKFRSLRTGGMNN